MPELTDKHDVAERILTEAQHAGVTISEQHAQMAVGWRAPYEDSIKKLRKIEYADREPAAIFIPVTNSDEIED